VMSDVGLCCFDRVARGMLMVTVSEVGMMRCRFVFPCLVVICGFFVVPRRVFMVFVLPLGDDALLLLLT
jgi:hypothetical protein